MKVHLKREAQDAVNDSWGSVPPNPKDRQFAYHLPNSLYLVEGGLALKGRRISLMIPAHQCTQAAGISGAVLMPSALT